MVSVGYFWIFSGLHAPNVCEGLYMIPISGTVLLSPRSSKRRPPIVSDRGWSFIFV